MNAERWQKVKPILDKLLASEPVDRDKILTQTCGDDSLLKAEVLELLALNNQADSFLSSPLVNLPAQIDNPSQQAALKQFNLEQDLLLMKNLIGKTLDGKYFIEKQLSYGGMGAVFKATHLGTSRPVALKIIMPQFMANQEFVERFRIEAKATGKLKHPNIVNITDFGFTSLDSDTIAYLVMEFLDGYNLADFLKSRGKLPLELVVDIVEQICLALNEAHKQDIIHRDLKPDNIWLEPNGRGGYNVKLLDFGLAKLRDNTIEPSPVSKLIGRPINLPTDLILNTKTIGQSFNQPVTNIFIDEETTKIQDSKSNGNSEFRTLNIDKGTTAGDIDPKTIPGWLTRVGSILGTPLYMSPEQCTGRELDIRSDIYSLGVIVYQMLAGETPFTGDIYELIYEHSKMPAPSLNQKCKDLPKAVVTLVMSTLSKNPEERPSSAKAFAKAMRVKTQGEDLIISQAEGIYQKNRLTFLKLSFSLYFPVIFCFYIFIFLKLVRTMIGDNSGGLTPTGIFIKSFINNSPITIVGWLAILLVLLFVNNINTAATALVLKQLVTEPSSIVRVRSILFTLLKQFPTLVVTLAKSTLLSISNLLKFMATGTTTYTEQLLCVPILFIEPWQKNNLWNRSKILVNHLKEQIITTQLRSIVTAFIALVLLEFGFMVFLLLDEIAAYDRSLQYLGLVPHSPSTLASIFGLIFAICILSIGPFIPTSYIVVKHSKLAIMSVLHYFTACEINSEQPKGTLDQFLQGTSDIKPNRFQYKQPLVLLASLFIIMAASQELKRGLFVSGLCVNNQELAPYLLSLGIDINTKSRFSQSTILMLATKQEKADLWLIQFLLSKGIDINAKNKYGETALISAISKGNVKIVNYLLSKNANMHFADDKEHFYNCLLGALSSRNNDMLKLVLAKSTDNRDVSRALCYAADNGYKDAIEILLASGADVNYQDISVSTSGETKGQTALHKAVLSNDIDMIKTLLAAGVKLDLKDSDGKTALQRAIDRGKREDIIGLLKTAEVKSKL